MKREEILNQPDGEILRLPCGKEEMIIYKIGSHLQLIFVAPSSPKRDLQSEIDLYQPWHLTTPYTQALLLGLLWQPRPQRIYQIGLGGGRVPMVMHHYFPEASITIAEISKQVEAVAAEYFGLSSNNHLRVILQDGRDYLEKLEVATVYDMIIVDAYYAIGDTPSQFTSREFYKLCLHHLTQEGVILMNIFPSFPNFQDKINSMKAVYQHVAQVPTGGNAVLIGFNQGEVRKQTLEHRALDIEASLGITFSLAVHARNLQFM